MPEPLNELERKVLDYVVEYLRTNTYQPSIREIGREFGIKSTKTVSELLQSLADKGWIERDPSRSRGVRLIGMELRGETVSLPFFEAGDGAPVTGHFALDRKLVATSGAFLIAMADDHLREDGVRAGDLLVVEAVEPDAIEGGDLIVARAAGALQARRCTRNGGDIVLEPVRTGDVPLRLTPRQAADVVRGRVTGVVRRLRPAARPEGIAVSVSAT